MTSWYHLSRAHGAISQSEYDLAKAKAERDQLKELLRSTPVVVIDERAAELRGEAELAAYARAIREWHRKVQTALTYLPNVN